MIWIITAMDENNVIGKDNDIPWYLPEDFKLFKEMTMGNTVVMGRKTFDSLPFKNGLPKRRNIVISRSAGANENVEYATSIEQAMEMAKSETGDVFVIGGATIYEKTLMSVDKLSVSHVKGTHDGDTFFPEIDPTKWVVESEVEYDGFTHIIYSRLV
jgi:dihydrofolate reductase